MLESPENPLPYKCSQDHIEMFFSYVRTQGGHIDNPMHCNSDMPYVNYFIETALHQVLMQTVLMTPLNPIRSWNFEVQKDLLYILML